MVDTELQFESEPGSLLQLEAVGGELGDSLRRDDEAKMLEYQLRNLHYQLFATLLIVSQLRSHLLGVQVEGQVRASLVFEDDLELRDHNLPGVACISEVSLGGLAQ